MASFEICWRKSTKKDLRDIPKDIVLRVLSAVEELAENPFPPNVVKLAGTERTYRLRVGDYRVIYELLVDVKIIEIQRVRHRREVYRS